MVVVVWGMTFISTKVLIVHGLSAQEIFLFRFLLGGLLKVCPIVSTKGLNKALYKTLPERHHGLIPLNMQAVEEGMKIMRKMD